MKIQNSYHDTILLIKRWGRRCFLNFEVSITYEFFINKRQNGTINNSEQESLKVTLSRTKGLQ